MKRKLRLSLLQPPRARPGSLCAFYRHANERRAPGPPLAPAAAALRLARRARRGPRSASGRDSERALGLRRRALGLQCLLEGDLTFASSKPALRIFTLSFGFKETAS